jgi:hypothetical protein
VVYIGLALGAAAQGWTGTWQLAIAVLAVSTAQQTIRACSRPNDGDLTTAGPLRRGLESVLAMPPGGRMVAVAIVAPTWGARVCLLVLLDWAIIAIGYAIGSRSAVRRRSRRAATVRRTAPQTEPSGLSVLLTPTRPSDQPGLAGTPAGRQSIPVLRMELTAPPPGMDLPSDPGLWGGESILPGVWSEPAVQAAAWPEPDEADAPEAWIVEDFTAGPGPDWSDPPPSDADWAAAAGAASAGPTAAVNGDRAGAPVHNMTAADGATDPAAADPAAAATDPTGTDPTASDPDADAYDRDERRLIAAIRRCRDDGAIALWFGSMVRGQLLPLPAALLALVAVSLLARLGLRDLPGLLILAPAIVMLVAAPGSGNPHTGRFDWLVPGVLLGAQYVYLASLGFAYRVPVVVTFALCAALAVRYADLACSGSPALPDRQRPARLRAALYRRIPSPAADGGGAADHSAADHSAADHGASRSAPDGSAPDQLAVTAEPGSWLGWEGRMIFCGLGAAMGIATAAYIALAVFLIGLVAWKVTTGYTSLRARSLA